MLVDTSYKTSKIPPVSIKKQSTYWVQLITAVVLALSAKICPVILPWILQLFFELSVNRKGKVICPIGGAGYEIPAQTIGIGIDSKDLFECLDDWIDLMNKKKANNKQQLAINGIWIRFSTKAKGYLSMYSNSNEIKGGCAFELPIIEFSNSKWPWNIIGETIEWKDTLDSTQELIMNKYNGCVHWGLYFNQKNDLFRNIHNKKMNSFIQSYQIFNVSGAFCNDFTINSSLDERTGFSKPTKHTSS